jgi:hypothetical protein
MSAPSFCAVQADSSLPLLLAKKYGRSYNKNISSILFACQTMIWERIAMAQKKSAEKNTKGFSHPDYDAAVLDCFLEKQLQLFPEEVASTPEEAADFLEMCFAVVARSKREVRQYFEEVGTDVEGEDIFSAAEVFAVGDGRYLIVEG